MVRGPAGDDHDPPQFAQLVVGDPDVAELHGVADQAVGDGLRHGVGLLVDLLEHEGLVTALLGGGVVPVDIGDLALERRRRRGVDELGAGSRDRHDFVVADQLDLPRLTQERRDGGCDEALPVADAHHEWALLASRDKQVGVVRGHRDERVVPAELGVRRPDGFHQLAGVVLGDQMGDDLGVGLRREVRASGRQPIAQLGVVLDDPVEDDVDPVGGVEVGVRVLLGHPAVRCPASVADADRRLGIRERDGRAVVGGGGTGGNGVAEEREVPHRAHGLDAPVDEQGDAGRVVAAVLEPLEPAEEQLPAGTATDVSDDPAHSLPPCFGAGNAFLASAGTRTNRAASGGGPGPFRVVRRVTGEAPFGDLGERLFRPDRAPRRRPGAPGRPRTPLCPAPRP